jgi:hypothetical protein
MGKDLMNPVRNFSRGLNPAAEQRGIISNGVNLSAEFNATTGLSYPNFRNGKRI